MQRFVSFGKHAIPQNCKCTCHNPPKLQMQILKSNAVQMQSENMVRNVLSRTGNGLYRKASSEVSTSQISVRSKKMNPDLARLLFIFKRYYVTYVGANNNWEEVAKDFYEYTDYHVSLTIFLPNAGISRFCILRFFVFFHFV